MHATDWPTFAYRPEYRRVTARVVGASILVLASVITNAWALSSDRNEPIEIEADRAEANERERVTIYRGGAVITQGTLRITGETVWIYFNEKDEFVKLVSEGNPAHLRQLPDNSTEYQMADANRLEYYAQKDLILLLGNAVYGQGTDSIRAERIEYDSLRGKMLARAASETDGGKTGSSRVRIRIIPKKKSSN